MGASGFSLGHLLVVLLVIILVFGTKKLREVGGDLGAALRDFKSALGSDKEPAAEQQEPRPAAMDAVHPDPHPAFPSETPTTEGQRQTPV